MVQLDMLVLSLSLGSSRRHSMRAADMRTVSAPWFLRLTCEPGLWCAWPRRRA